MKHVISFHFLTGPFVKTIGIPSTWRHEKHTFTTKPPSLYRFDLGGGEIDPFSSSCLPEFRVCRGRASPSFYRKNISQSQSLTSPKNLLSWCFQKRELRSWMYQKSPFIVRERLGATPQVSISTSLVTWKLQKTPI